MLMSKFVQGAVRLVRVASSASPVMSWMSDQPSCLDEIQSPLLVHLLLGQIAVRAAELMCILKRLQLFQRQHDSNQICFLLGSCHHGMWSAHEWSSGPGQHQHAVHTKAQNSRHVEIASQLHF